jgi:hypothetical protein
MATPYGTVYVKPAHRFLEKFIWSKNLRDLVRGGGGGGGVRVLSTFYNYIEQYEVHVSEFDRVRNLTTCFYT